MKTINSTTGIIKYEMKREIANISNIYRTYILKSLKIVAIIQLSFYCSISFAQVDDSYYLPEISYNSEIPTPKEILNYQIGEWHISHDQLVYCLEKLCASSDKCSYKEYGRTHENRPLINLVISNPKNLKDIDNIVQNHAQLTDPLTSKNIETEKTPIIIYQGYSVHGNESSGANASPMVAYYLLAGQSNMLEELLEESIIILDPCYNPDGLQRFSTWANSHKHKNLTSDPSSREFNEVWPGGRTNHYWFDLNRDWIFNIHPSSASRIANFHYWKPDILTDHHEMGSNSTFFFQPGIPSRTNPNTPPINQSLTEEIGTYHAASLDSIGSLYYTKESFDDFYYGKGSTYPDINGCIGILFEQASARGHLRKTNSGLLSFPFTIRNQFVTALSTQKAGLEMKETILNFKRDFYKDRYKKASDGYYIWEEADHYKASFFVNMLTRHGIDIYKNNKNRTLQGKQFSKTNSYIVPKKQRQTTLVKTIFERVNTFQDSLFYDVSAWTLPLAMNMKYAEVDEKLDMTNAQKVSSITYEKTNNPIDEKDYAVAINWSNYHAPTLLYSLLDKDINIRVITEATPLKSNGKQRSFEVGTVIVPLANQKMEKSELVAYINQESEANYVDVYPIDTGFSVGGKSLGSPQRNVISKPNIAMIVGNGINAYEAGDNWYQLDYRYKIPVTMLDKQQIVRADLDKYNIIILPDGSYSKDDKAHEKIKEWVAAGGTLLCIRRAITYANDTKLIDLKVKKKIKKDTSDTSYTKFRNYRGSQVMGGAILESAIDLDHPLFYGYEDPILPVFKRGTQFYKVTEKASTPLVYTSDPMLSGYASKQNAEKAQGAAGIVCFAQGKGKVIAMVDNPNFRGYWLGGSKLFANAIFFHSLITNEKLSY